MSCPSGKSASFFWTFAVSVPQLLKVQASTAELTLQKQHWFVAIAVITIPHLHDIRTLQGQPVNCLTCQTHWTAVSPAVNQTSNSAGHGFSEVTQLGLRPRFPWDPHVIRMEMSVGFIVASLSLRLHLDPCCLEQWILAEQKNPEIEDIEKSN